MLTQFLKSSSLALALVLAMGAVQPLFAQHHHHHGGSIGGYGGGFGGGGYYGGSHHHHSGIGIGIGLGGLGYGGYGYGSGYGGLGYGSSYGYGGLGYGNNYGYGGYGYGNSLYGSSYYNSYPSYGYSSYNSYPSYGYSSYGSGYGSSGSSIYVAPRYVTSQIVTPRYVTSSPVYTTPSVIYQSPSVQSTNRISIPTQDQDNGQRTNLPGVTFGGRAHIPELAGAVSERTNQLCVALSDSYRDNPQFNEVYRDTYSVIGLAQQLAQPSGAADSAAMLGSLSDINAIMAQAAPMIQSWKSNSGASASATSHLSSVQSALKLLSIDAGWDASQAASRPTASSTAPTATPPTAAPIRVAPAPALLPTESTPTPADPVPAP